MGAIRDYVFIEQDIEVLRKEIYGSRKQMFLRLTEQCARYKEKALSPAHPAESTTYMGIAIANLALAYALTSQVQYLSECRRWIRAVVGYEKWGHAHLVDVDLSAAWILFGLALGYDWTKDALDEAERQAIHNKLHLQATKMFTYKKNTEGAGWATTYWQNHNWINLTGLSAAGYSLINAGLFIDDAQRWIDDAKANFEIVYEGLPEDGSNYEGVVYWRYGAMWLHIYAHLLKEREGIDYFKICPFLEQTLYYRIYQSDGDYRRQLPFGDCHDRFSGHSTAIYFKIASEYNNPHAQYLGHKVVNDFLYQEAMESKVKPGILPEAIFEFLFYDPKVDQEDFSSLPLVKKFDDLGLVCIRSSWDADALVFSAKCSPPGGHKQWSRLWDLKEGKGYESFGLAHHHPDNTSFIICANGEFLAIDEGYNRKPAATEHNMILVDGRGYEGERQADVYADFTRSMVGDMLCFEENDTSVYFVAETHKTYARDLKMTKVRRHYIYLKQPQLIIMLDELESETPHSYTWQLHSDTAPQVAGEGVRYQAQWENGLAAMSLHSICSMKAIHTLDKTHIKEIMTTQEPTNFREITMQSLRIITMDTGKKCEFYSVLETRRACDKGRVIGVDVALDGSVRHISISTHDGQINAAVDLKKLVILEK